MIAPPKKPILAIVSLLALAALGFALRNGLPVARPAFASAAHLALAAPLPTAATPPAAPPAPEAPRADRALDRSGYTLVGAGAMFVPDSFTSKDGSYDLVIHFHGNAALVAESFSLARVNAILLVINVGIGSGAYDTRYAVPAMFDLDLDRVRQAIGARGLEGARMERLALSAWSAGYGAVGRILDIGRAFARVDAVLLCDAPHTGFTDVRERTVDLVRLAPFLRFARAAAKRDKLMTITHSQIGENRYATTTETTDAILRDVGAYRERRAAFPPPVEAPVARAAMSSARWLEQISEAHLGLFSVRGYRGVTEDDHIAHLAQMSVTVLPELVAYWKTGP
jgi:hypothetical protein